MGRIPTTGTITRPGTRELLEKGLLGRGIIVSVQHAAVSTGPHFDPAHVCVFTVEVALDKVPQYSATCHQAVRGVDLLRRLLPGATVAVRVDPEDHSRIALSLGERAPVVAPPASGAIRSGPAARLRDHGTPCAAVIRQSQPLGMRSSDGHDMYVLVLTVLADGASPYQAQIGSPVPAEALALVYPGNTVPARRMPDGKDYEIAIDWPAALTQVRQAVA